MICGALHEPPTVTTTLLVPVLPQLFCACTQKLVGCVMLLTTIGLPVPICGPLPGNEPWNQAYVNPLPPLAVTDSWKLLPPRSVAVGVPTLTLGHPVVTVTVAALLFAVPHEFVTCTQ